MSAGGCLHCGASLEGKRPDALYCCSEHRAAEYRRRQEQAFSTAPTQPRRASRDGKGTRYYLLPNEVAALQESRLQPGVDAESWQSAQRKLAKRKTPPATKGNGDVSDGKYVAR